MEEKEWSDWNYERRNASGVFVDGPGWIKKLIITGDATGEARAVFYDGHTATGKPIITMRAVDKDMRTLDFEIPIRIEQGLYILFVANLECVAVQYKKDKP